MAELVYEEEHRMFREAFKKFCEQEITPNVEAWEAQGHTGKEIWKKAGEQGFLCPQIPEEYGGLGLDDFRYNNVIAEELGRIGSAGLGIALHNDITVPYLISFGTEEQKKKYLPQFVTGEIISSIAMTEPGTGSDLQGIKTKAELRGDHYVLNGQKTFITNGYLSNLCIVAARTSDEPGHQSMSLLLVESGWEGYAEGKRLHKIGMHAQDTAELYFENVQVPKENLLGGTEGNGFIQLMQKLPQERLSLASGSIAAAERALEITLDYCKERKAFGKAIGSFQHSKFTLAEMHTELAVARVFVDHCIALHNKQELTVEKAAMLKWWATELQNKVVNQCVQLHGGYGYMMEYEIARMFIDGRVTTIYGGTTEIMKEIVGRSMGL